MGNPTHFSLEVPKRAHQLLRDLYERLSDSEEAKLPLKATFLLSISMPIIVLPLERILKYKRNPAEVHMNDVVLNPKLADAVDRAIDLQGQVHQADFFGGSWQYASLAKGSGFPNLAIHGLPEAIATELDSPDAVEHARNLTANCFCKILRNALAHGGVLYLDEHGRSCSGAPVRRFAFVSTNAPYRPTKLHFLRITMADYRTFLQRWVDWLNIEAIEQVLADDLDLEALQGRDFFIPGDAVEAVSD
jgi:hypothetical protein